MELKMSNQSNQVVGSILGLALGDAFGAPYEGGFLERALWKLLGTTNGKQRWTDDTQMTINVIESLLAHGCVNQDDLAERFANSYRWSRGYGPGAAKLLNRIKRGQPWQMANRAVFRDGSFGNGGAMRAPVIGIFFAKKSDEFIVQAAKQCAEITHAHSHGLEGAGLIALTISLSFTDLSSIEVIKRLRGCTKLKEFTCKLIKVEHWLQQSKFQSPKIIAKELGNGIAAENSCITAIYIAFIHRKKSFDELLDYTIKVRGDVDTIAAMAGEIWGAIRGCEDLPTEKLKRLEQLDEINELAILLVNKIK